MFYSCLNSQTCDIIEACFFENGFESADSTYALKQIEALGVSISQLQISLGVVIV